ncbi:MAG: hypothetical protein KDJ52_00920 [Anaerolineae bacterium]|nr:hypothetical protein [Anaerolineae bacterium]
MDVKTIDRTKLKSYFIKNSIPTEGNFADLIEGMLNQKDDGIVKAPGNPLSIEAAGDDNSEKKALNIYRSFGDQTPAWTLNLNPRSKPNDPTTAKPGFNISDGEGNSRLFIDRNSGNIGIGTNEPAAKLDVKVPKNPASGEPLFRVLSANNSERLRVEHDGALKTSNHLQVDGTGDSYIKGKVGIGTTSPQQKLVIKGDQEAKDRRDPNNNMSLPGQLAIVGNAPQIDFINTKSKGWSIRVYDSKLYFIRETWQSNNLVIDEDGRVGIGTGEPGAKLHVINTNQNAEGNTLILGPTNASNLRLGYHAGYSWIQSHGAKPLAINPVGNNVGIGTESPAAKLDVKVPKNPTSGEPIFRVLSANNSERLRVEHEGALKTSNYLQVDGTGDSYIKGKVGIGTDEPSAKLHVINTNQDAGGNTLILGPTNNASHLRLGYHADYSWIQSHGSKPLAINPVGNNVGIGTTSPGAGLEINKSNTSDLALRVTSSGPGWGSGIQFTNTSQNGRTYGIYTDQQGIWHFVDESAQVDRLVIDKEGNVGIGTASPKAKLDVVGDWAQFWGRRGTFKVGEVAGDGNWHSILSKLNGHQAYELIADIGVSGRHGLTHAIVVCTYGSSNSHPGVTMTQADYVDGKIEVKWDINKSGENAPIYNYDLQIRTVTNYGTGKNISYRLTKLW